MDERRALALRAYERGRWNLSLLRALPALGVTAGAALLVPQSRWEVSTAGGLLYLVCVWLLYLGGAPGRAVPGAIGAGLAPLLALTVADLLSCSDSVCDRSCMIVCGLSGLVIGGSLGIRAARTPEHRVQMVWIGGGIALLSAAVGCQPAGIGDLLAMTISFGLALPTTLTAFARERTAG